ncbi:MAG: hypothetical protein J7524_23230 [Roseofilum sp. Belize BBD 4]|uniref:hypothetical protein n=1 Tax=Roseofilum sp. Belize BBD 4 TaxID=2821500 RepID=UPI001B21CAC8|nr:hypothetical protein [Roseofilum sp. Belize BBD 4]MBP0036039.1 hypothetical protein [Roseofilum sp. Belize BBD 4]
MNNITGREVIEVLQEIQEIEWGKCNSIEGVEENLYYPPIIVWRFKNSNQTIESLIVKAVESFQGNVDWEITKTRKNWVISPKKIREFQEQKKYRIYTEALSDLSEKNPEFCRQANEDVPALAQKIKEITIFSKDKDFDF